MWILGLKGLSIPANSYILGSQTPLQRPLCCREAGENGKGISPLVCFLLIFDYCYFSCNMGAFAEERASYRHESLTYRLNTFDFFELTLSNKLAFWLKFQLFDGMVCSWWQEGRFVICDW